MGELAADFYELDLAEVKTTEQVEAERREAFKQKYITHLRQEYAATLATFSSEDLEGEQETVRQDKERAIEQTFKTLSERLARVSELEFGNLEQAVLKLKLARHFQGNETVDTSTLFDALIESPKFMGTAKGSLHRLLEVHEEKTLQKIAEIRKRKAEQTGDEEFNPYEALFKTISGEYYLARLLNMPHLEEESDYMRHCVGTSDSYISQMKRGEIEILSLRRQGKLDRKTGKIEKDVPVMTIEFNPKTGVIEQMKKADNECLKPADPFYADVIDALRQLRETTTDTGKTRRVKQIAASELENLSAVKPGHLLTDVGELSWSNFVPSEERLILKIGEIALDPQTPKEDLVKMLKFFAEVELPPDRIARTVNEIGPDTQAYVGKLEPGIFARLPKTVEHVYTSFPEGKIRRDHIEIGGKTSQELQDMMAKSGIKFEHAKFMMDSPDFTVSENPEPIDLIRLRVGNLGLSGNLTTDQIYKRIEELGLELCPAEVGPRYRLARQDQPTNGWVNIGMKPISDQDGDPLAFSLAHLTDGLRLHDGIAKPDDAWPPESWFVFRLRKEA